MSPMHRSLNVALFALLHIATLPPSLVAGAPAEVNGHSPTPIVPMTSAGSGDAMALLVCSPNAVTLFKISITVDGRPLAAIWEQTFSELFRFLDRDGNGNLDLKEQRLIPSPFTLRQVLWGQIIPWNPSSDLCRADRDRNRTVCRDEIAAYFLESQIGCGIVAMGVASVSESLTSSLIRLLDSNIDGRISNDELHAAEKQLRSLDANGDELISPMEINPQSRYPGAAATTMISPPILPSSPESASLCLPLLLLPSTSGSIDWCRKLMVLYDSDGDQKISDDEVAIPRAIATSMDMNHDSFYSLQELATWPTCPVVPTFSIHLATRSVQADSKISESKEDTSDPVIFAVSVGERSLRLQPCDGDLEDELRATADQLDADFTSADKDDNGSLTMDEIDATFGLSQIGRLACIADANNDGALARRELDEWMQLQRQIACGHVLLSVLDHGQGLFELLDRDLNQQLSIREMRSAREALLNQGTLSAEGDLIPEKLPYLLVMRASVGHASKPRRRLNAPTWFNAMDQNGDGDISHREFHGSAEVFRDCDRDADGLIDVREALLASPVPLPPSK